MKPEHALKTALEKLAEAGIDYMITGSFASNLYGIPRTTYDADIVIEAKRPALTRFIKLIEDEFYVSPEAVEEALEHERIFNIIHLTTGLKIDLIIRKNREFSKEEFKRRRQEKFLGMDCWFASPEDTILSKLEWSKMGESERQFLDALGIARIQGEKLNKDYLKRWAGKLHLQQEMARLFQELED